LTKAALRSVSSVMCVDLIHSAVDCLTQRRLRSSLTRVANCLASAAVGLPWAAGGLAGALPWAAAGRVDRSAAAQATRTVDSREGVRIMARDPRGTAA
jgi:hypothetical protein